MSTRALQALILAAALAAGIASPALAETRNYACHQQDDAHLYAAKLDTRNKTLTWRGSVYRNLKEVAADCPNKECFFATGRDGARAELRTATDGVAYLQAGLEEADCDLVRSGHPAKSPPGYSPPGYDEGPEGDYPDPPKTKRN